MTKAAMIQEIQRQEAKLFLELKEATRDFGREHEFTRSRRAAYSAIYELMAALSITMDIDLADNVKALEIFFEYIQNQAQ